MSEPASAANTRPLPRPVDPELSRETIQRAIDDFYVWLDRLVGEGRMRVGQRLGTEGRTVARRSKVTTARSARPRRSSAATGPSSRRASTRPRRSPPATLPAVRPVLRDPADRHRALQRRRRDERDAALAAKRSRPALRARLPPATAGLTLTGGSSDRSGTRKGGARCGVFRCSVRLVARRRGTRFWQEPRTRRSGMRSRSTWPLQLGDVEAAAATYLPDGSHTDILG